MYKTMGGGARGKGEATALTGRSVQNHGTLFLLEKERQIMSKFCSVCDSEDDDDDGVCAVLAPTAATAASASTAARSVSPCENGGDDDDDLLESIGASSRSGPRRRRRVDGPRRASTSRTSASRTSTALTVRALTPEPRYDRPDTNRMDQIFACATSVNRQVEQIRNCVRALGCADPALLDEIEQLLSALPSEAMAMARQASALCEESAVQVSLMRQALSEELVDLEVRAVRVAERQRALRDNGRDEEAGVLARSIAAAQRVDASMVTLHPHASYAHPGAALVNGPMLALSRRADDRG